MNPASKHHAQRSRNGRAIGSPGALRSLLAWLLGVPAGFFALVFLLENL